DLEEALNQRSAFSVQRSTKNSELRTPNSELSFKVYVAMRYWHPLIEEVIPEIYNAGIKKLIALSLYPQYSVATSGSSFSKLRETVHSSQFTVHYITSWFNHPLYIEALVDVIKKGIESFTLSLPLPPIIKSPPPLSSPACGGRIWWGRGGGQGGGDIHVLFSAHSLPQKFIDEGDPYVNQIMGTIEAITKKIDIKWHLSYQSKSGPVQWLKPLTDEKLKELARKGVRNILVVPISFVSDHIETLYEIDILYKKMADRLGINLRRTESLNIHPLFIEALKDMVMKGVSEIGWI
ncbi:MAG: ferrochelatase, partial [Nitrospirae bacterium]|nr:ferrochelatase [Nitrospirota bacterium]